jgi:cytochrome c-type biogenesis protein
MTVGYFLAGDAAFSSVTTYITHLTGGNIEKSKMLVNATTLYMRSIGFIIGLSNIISDGRIAEF